eukprot:TRINITY_DN3907_c0_g1_i7.p1 TRINITY_DN3907_c0_g1~~TRINITY_DN3907_c0_g1_i7.p1  ORF type:complete len:799 (-),score=142.80 TRINITY_DN3907_c0_g1_i7:272-2668(-)
MWIIIQQLGFLLLIRGCLVVGQHEQQSHLRSNQERDDTAEEKYQKAMQIRYQSEEVSIQQLQSVWELLSSSSGVVINNSSYDSSWISQDNKTMNGFKGVQFTRYPPHASALCEMAFALERGDGVSKNTFLGFYMLKFAAELGNSKCQGEYGMRLALGVRPDQQGKRIVGEIVEGDTQKALVMYFIAASDNDSLACLAMGYRHMEGIGVPQSCYAAVSYLDMAAAKVIEVAARPEGLPRFEKPRLSFRAQNDFRSTRDSEVLQYYQNTADLGNVQHQNIVGELYFMGSFGHKDLGTAYRYFLKAARGGDSDAMANLGHMYANGLGVTPSNESAIYWFKKAADANNFDGHYGLGYMYLNGYGVPLNYTMALRSFRRAAEGKHIEAYYHLGVMFSKGWGLKSPSDAQALRYFGLAAQHGHTTAAYNAALMQVAGRGTTPNCDTALQSFRKIIQKGPWMGMFEQGYDKFMKRDYDAALLEYLRGSEMGIELANSNAAWMLERGLGVEGSLATQLMIKLNRRAVELGNQQGLLAMGDTFFYGNGVDQDMKQAANLYRQAAEQKSVMALFNLGFMHHFGAGLPMDTHLAKRYYDEAIREDNKARMPVVPFLVMIYVQNWWKDFREILAPWIQQGVEETVQKFAKMAVPVPGTHVQHAPPHQGWLLSLLDISIIEGVITWVFSRLEQVLFSKKDTPDENENEAFTSSSDAFESVIIVVLVIALLTVLQRRRQMIRTRQQNEGTSFQGGAGGNNQNDGQQQQQQQYVEFQDNEVTPIQQQTPSSSRQQGEEDTDTRDNASGSQQQQ